MNEELEQLIQNQLSALERGREELLELRQSLRTLAAESEEVPADEKPVKSSPVTANQEVTDQVAEAAALPESKEAPVESSGDLVAFHRLDEAEMRRMYLGAIDPDGNQKLIDIIYSRGEATVVTLSYYLTVTSGVLLPLLKDLREQGILKEDGPRWIPARPGQEIELVGS